MASSMKHNLHTPHLLLPTLDEPFPPGACISDMLVVMEIPKSLACEEDFNFFQKQFSWVREELSKHNTPIMKSWHYKENTMQQGSGVAMMKKTRTKTFVIVEIGMERTVRLLGRSNIFIATSSCNLLPNSATHF